MKFYCSIADEKDPCVSNFKHIVNGISQEDALHQYVVMALNHYQAEGMPGPLIYVSTWGHADDIVSMNLKPEEIPQNHGFGVWLHHKLYAMELHEEAEIVRKKFSALIQRMRSGKTGAKKVDIPPDEFTGYGEK